jgi:hypothetical protein
MMSKQAPRTLFQKIWDAHVVARVDASNVVLYIDRHLVNEVTSPQAFEGLRIAGRSVRRPEGTIAVADHNVPTEHRDRPIAEEGSRIQVATLERNVVEFHVPYCVYPQISTGDRAMGVDRAADCAIRTNECRGYCQNSIADARPRLTVSLKSSGLSGRCPKYVGQSRRPRGFPLRAAPFRDIPQQQFALRGDGKALVGPLAVGHNRFFADA